MHKHDQKRGLRWRGTAAMSVALLLAGCGGGGGDEMAPPASCSVAEQKVWLRDYFNEWYFWYGVSPKPDPSAYATVDEYFNALLYQGGQGFPADRWSYKEPEAKHQQFFGEGRTLGYGVYVAGREVENRPDLPLRVRFVEPKSPAAAADIRRGDEVLAVNGRAAADMIAANDFAVLTPANSGNQVTLQLRRNGSTRSVTLTAVDFDLTPVPTSTVINTGDGRRTGYLVLSNFISQAEGPLDAAFGSFKTAGITELVIDLRYNGGGLVSTAAKLASYIAGNSANNQVFTQLLYNNKRSSNNSTYRFSSFGNSLGVSKVYVLTGRRTCSASEMLVNGLRPFVEVVTIGETSCGKPVGFLPQSACGTTYSIVNFEAVNAQNQGRYFNGFQASCAVADDLDDPMGSASEALLSTARYHASRGVCPPEPLGTGQARALSSRSGADRAPQRSTEPDGPGGMIDR